MIRYDQWSSAEGLTLEPNALTAVMEQIRCQALTAGPGAGKTEMLAQRADFLLRTGLCRYPKRILAISFKVDASRNLKERVTRRCGASLGTRVDSYTFHAFSKRIIDRFRPVLTGQDALDVDYTIGENREMRHQITFNDLVPLAIRILETSDVAKNAIRQTYADVFLDEFQDCTDRQYQLVRLAFHGTATRLVAVGDTKQRIMGWAGALEGIFVSFAQDFRAVPLNLYRNFRSQPKLLRMQNRIIADLDVASIMPEELIDGAEGTIEVQRFESSQDEAESLAERISDLMVEDGVPCSEIAILVSKQAELYAERLMAELEQQGVPYRNEQQVQDLCVEPVTRLIVDYLLVLLGDRQPDEFARLTAQLSDLTFAEREQSRLRDDWLRFIKEERAKARTSVTKDGSFRSVWEYARSFLRKLGKERLISLSADYESIARLREVIEETRTRLSDKWDAEPGCLDALTNLTDDHAVRIMTIHKSKGLEFDCVIILGVENETFWGKPVDERCAFFVGVSRAKKHLILTHAGVRPRPENHTRRWDVSRTPHAEFIGYAEPFC